MKVNVMLRCCGGPPQAPMTMVTASAATALEAVDIMLRLRMSIACPADGVGGKGLRWLVQKAQKSAEGVPRGD
ncbi:hypothetical protein MPRM_29650 [Mycobacterium parmense]|uniref:Uncharacterized protein n=1 Tax=Mycobacterium parmense TaxID=185642 RepID=A0A7I7YXJ7_9MYCO|nr:hypothetical protein MPRM_29650 [Mycobacterium parmense]